MSRTDRFISSRLLVALLGCAATVQVSVNSANGMTMPVKYPPYEEMKAMLKPPAEQTNYGLVESMLVVAQGNALRLSELRPYMRAKDRAVRHVAIAYLMWYGIPGSAERVAHELGSKDAYAKQSLLHFLEKARPSETQWRLVPILIPVISDPAPLKLHGKICSYSYELIRAKALRDSVPFSQRRFCRVRDLALSAIVRFLGLDLPFQFDPETTFTKEQRALIKQKLRELGYRVTNNPYPVTDAH